MSGSHFSGVDGIDAEVLVGDPAVLISDQAVPAHHVGIEFDLHFGVLGDDLQHPGQVLHEHPPRLADGIHVGVVPVTVVGQLLHQDVVVIAHAESNR